MGGTVWEGAQGTKLMSVFSILFAVQDSWVGRVVNIHQTVHLYLQSVLSFVKSINRQNKIQEKLSFMVTENALTFKFLTFWGLPWKYGRRPPGS